MRAIVFEGDPGHLRLMDLPVPEPGPNQVRIRVHACGVCRTDLHILDGELPEPRLPLVPGHQVVGTVDSVGSSVSRLAAGARVGVPWLGHTCGECVFCQTGRENLCPRAEFTGYDRNGGFAEYCLADEAYTFHLPEAVEDVQAAPLLCAGLIGYRAFRMVEDAEHIGFYGFGSAAHLLVQVACHLGKKVYAFTRPKDPAGEAFAGSLGAVWAGGSDQAPPRPLDAAIIFAPVGALVPVALRSVDRGGIVVCAGIHMSDIPSFPYSLLWQERSVRSVANLTRRDAEEFLRLAPQVPVRSRVTTYALEDTLTALNDLRAGAVEGSAVITVSATP